MKPPIAALPFVGLAALLAATIACGQDRAVGGERQPCRQPVGDAAVCGAGLTCMSGVCVRPPPADCAAVAELLLSLEVGNYASREERAGKLPAKRALCEQHRISVDEAACLAKVSDTWSAGDCVPRLFPRAEGGGCEPVMVRIRAAIAGAAGSDPTAAPMVAKMMTILEQSCVEDEWPEPLRRCFLASRPGDLEAFSACEKVTPPALREKIEQRRMRNLSP